MGVAAPPRRALRSADIAMYRAKSQGKGNYAIYEPSMHAPSSSGSS